MVRSVVRVLSAFSPTSTRWSRKLALLAVMGMSLFISPKSQSLAADPNQSIAEQEAEAEAMEHMKKVQERREAKKSAPPSALPGAESSEEDEENGHANSDLNPTLALFDAINRGSLNAAKEALSRGADISAHNVLDQTPLDMAIDLNRNDIMFVLLSLRVYNPDGRLYTRSAHKTTGSGKLNISSTAAKKIPPTVPIFDKSGGKAAPSVGFLGFQPARITSAPHK